MRAFNHCLAASRSGKSMLFRITVNDRYGERMITLSSVTGWRATLARRYLSLDSNEWNDQAVRTFVGLNVLSAAKDRCEAIHYIDTVKSIGSAEIHFWASKFLNSDKAPRRRGGLSTGRDECEAVKPP